MAAIYLAVALLAAMPYFLLVVDYPSATTAADKVSLVVDNYSSMYTVYIATYVFAAAARWSERSRATDSSDSPRP